MLSIVLMLVFILSISFKVSSLVWYMSTFIFLCRLPKAIRFLVVLFFSSASVGFRPLFLARIAVLVSWCLLLFVTIGSLYLFLV